MRIICPGCGAEYAIPDKAIPATGREVQCATCTHAWYQLPISNAAEHQADRHAPLRPERDPQASVVPSPKENATKGAAISNASGAPALETEDGGERDANLAPAAIPEAPGHRVDPEVLRILREEAAFEAQARRTKGEVRGPQHATGHAPVTSSARLARLQAAEKASGPLAPPPDLDAMVEDTVVRAAPPPLLNAATPDARPRRDLPMLRPTPPEMAALRHRAGFRWGFGATAGLFCATLATYLAAPHLALALPDGQPLADAIMAQGARVQNAIVSLVRSAMSDGDLPS